MSDDAELAMVLKAVTSGLSNCVKWKNEVVKNRVLRDTNLTPRGFREELARCIRDGNYKVKQKVEDREEYSGIYDYVYHFTIPLQDFPYGYYAEIVVEDIREPEYPVVVIVSVHAQTR